MFYKESLTVDSSGSSCLESARSLVSQLFLLKGFREKGRHVACYTDSVVFFYWIS
jgi:hypothetical protein